MKCKKCLYDNKHPFGITFSNRLCSGCFTHEEKYKINWNKREELLFEKINQIKNNNKSYYDCVIPFTGDAEDYHVLNIVLNMKLNPLLIGINNYFNNDIGWHNIHNLISHFDVDSYIYNPEIFKYKELVRTSLRKHSHAMWPSLALQSSFHVHIAKKRKIPLIIYGQNQSIEQVGKFSHFDEVESSCWSRVEHDLFGYDVHDILTAGSHVAPDSIPYYHYPKLNNLGKGKLIGLYLSNFYKWDPLLQNSRVKKFGFKPEKQLVTFDPYERAGSSIYYGFHDLSKLNRIGYRKIHDQVTREIRHKRITKAEGEKITNDYKSRKVYIKNLFDWLDVSETGYKWFIEKKLKNIKHLISENKKNTSEQAIILPKAIKKLIQDGQKSDNEFHAFKKGIYL